MKLPVLPHEYTRIHETQRNEAITAADAQNVKIAQDNYMQGRIILVSPDGTWWAITVDNAGALSAVAV